MSDKHDLCVDDRWSMGTEQKTGISVANGKNDVVGSGARRRVKWTGFVRSTKMGNNFRGP